MIEAHSPPGRVRFIWANCVDPETSVGERIEPGNCCAEANHRNFATRDSCRAFAFQAGYHRSIQALQDGSVLLGAGQHAQTIFRIYIDDEDKVHREEFMSFKPLDKWSVKTWVYDESDDTFYVKKKSPADECNEYLSAEQKQKIDATVAGAAIAHASEFCMLKWPRTAEKPTVVAGGIPFMSGGPNGEWWKKHAVESLQDFEKIPGKEIDAFADPMWMYHVSRGDSIILDPETKEIYMMMEFQAEPFMNAIFKLDTKRGTATKVVGKLSPKAEYRPVNDNDFGKRADASFIHWSQAMELDPETKELYLLSYAHDVLKVDTDGNLQRVATNPGEGATLSYSKAEKQIIMGTNTGIYWLNGTQIIGQMNGWNMDRRLGKDAIYSVLNPAETRLGDGPDWSQDYMPPPSLYTGFMSMNDNSNELFYADAHSGGIWSANLNAEPAE
jgi:hypothetical protein